MIVATVVLTVAGIAARYPELLAVGIAAGLTVLLAALWMLAVPDVEIVREIRPLRVVEGEPALAVLTVTNGGRRRCPPLTARESVAGRELVLAVPSVGPGARYEATYPLPTARRGVFDVGPLTVGHADPLRLMQVGRAFRSRSVLRVQPRVFPVLPLPVGGSPDLDGPTSSTAPQGGVAFHSLREYARGDDPRLIHWRSTARTGTLMVRHNVVPNEPRMLIILDTSAEPYRRDYFEDAVRIAGSLAVSGRAHGFPVELRTTAGDRTVVDDFRYPPAALLDLLCQVKPDPADPGLSVLPHVVPAEAGVALGVITGQASHTQLAAVSAVRSRFAMASLVMVGEEHGRPAPAVRGALVVNVRASADFEAVWDRQVRR